METAAREIVHEAIQLPRSTGQHPVHGESTDFPNHGSPEQANQPHHAPDIQPARINDSRIKWESPPQRTPAPTPQEQARRAYVQQAAKAAAAPPIKAEPTQAQMAKNMPRQRSNELHTHPAEKQPRERTDDLKIRTESAQQQKSTKKLPQEQARRTFLKQKQELGPSQNVKILRRSF